MTGYFSSTSNKHSGIDSSFPRVEKNPLNLPETYDNGNAINVTTRFLVHPYSVVTNAFPIILYMHSPFYI